MKRNTFLKIALILFCGLFITNKALAQKDQIEGTWYNEEKTAKVWIYLAKNGKYYGKIIWLKEPNDANGNPKTDTKNPDASKRNEPILDMLILKGFEKDGSKEYDDGTIYDPKNGKTYSCVITYKGDKLSVRGYVGITLIGRTTTWTKAED